MISVLLARVHGICVVEVVGDGNPIPLNLKRLPNGVRYDSSDDSIHCERDQACVGMRISNCGAVYCQARDACRTAELLYNRHVYCWEEHACQQTNFWQSTIIDCGTGKSYEKGPCEDAVIRVESELNCVGTRACINPTPARLNVYTGSTGRVRCSSHAPGIAMACRNMLIHVDAKSRACYTNSDTEDLECAVACITQGACDKNTILFEHY